MFMILAVSHARPPSPDPVVTIKNGKLSGVYSPTYKQELFLGIPFASKPVGDLRFAQPRPHQDWEGIRSAKQYGPHCMGGSLGLLGFDPTISYPQDEDCLTINVVRPCLKENKTPLPVLVWIYGGGFKDGGSGDHRYNMSYLAQTSVEMGMPTIMVSFNYRLTGWGFLSGKLMQEQGLANLGLQDQRMALRWIQDNIANFGGDPTKVTIQGESAGGSSVGYHLLAYGGRDDGLFSGAIAQSRGPSLLMPMQSADQQQSRFEAIATAANCSTSLDSLNCLRSTSSELLNEIFNRFGWNPVVDGELIPDTNSKMLNRGAFVKVPLLIGANTNEGTVMVPGFSRINANDTEDFYNAVRYTNLGVQISNGTLRRLDELYTDAASKKSDSGLGTVLSNPGYPYGTQYAKTSLYLGDYLFTAPRRITSQAWAKSGVASYSYRFGVTPAGQSAETIGATHFAEVAFVFGNVNGQGYDTNPFAVASWRKRYQYKRVSELMSRMWLSFANTGSPNYHGVSWCRTKWPLYGIEEPENMVFQAGSGCHRERDDYRVETMDLLKSIGGNDD
ncbi:Nn.00g008240.m01.CDS01 [Neocucurbitaria sp. VM-36]